MSEENKFCPNCGADLEGKKVCQSCGFELEQAQSTTAYSNTNENVWKTIEKWVVMCGKYSWVFLLVNMITYIITGIVALVASSLVSTITSVPLWAGIWMLLGAVLSGVILWFWVLPFSRKIAAKDYAFLVDDVIVMGKLRVPKMLLLGIVLEVFTQGWGGLFVLVPALCICFLGPEYMRWRA